jgi:phosphohistidine phosphatase
VKRLTVVRHANADWKDSAVADFDRPLNRKGMAEAEATAKRLLEQELTPDLVVTSPARRTQQTADIIAREHGFGSRRVKRDEHLYLASAEDILKVIRGTGPKVDHLAVVGHNPGISELLKLLAPTAEVTDLATGACCTMTFKVTMWNSIALGGAQDVKYEAPPAGLLGSLFS